MALVYIIVNNSNNDYIRKWYIWERNYYDRPKSSRWESMTFVIQCHWDSIFNGNFIHLHSTCFDLACKKYCLKITFTPAGGQYTLGVICEHIPTPIVRKTLLSLLLAINWKCMFILLEMVKEVIVEFISILLTSSCFWLFSCSPLSSN